MFQTLSFGLLFHRLNFPPYTTTKKLPFKNIATDAYHFCFYWYFANNIMAKHFYHIYSLFSNYLVIGFFQKQKDGTPTVKLIENKIVSHIKHFCRGHLKSLCMFVNLYKVTDVIVSQLFDWSCEFHIIFAAFRVLPTCPWEMAQLCWYR